MQDWRLDGPGFASELKRLPHFSVFSFGAVSPVYLVSMPGEVKDPPLLEKDNSKINPPVYNIKKYRKKKKSLPASLLPPTLD